jgi:hypothetical protein
MSIYDIRGSANNGQYLSEPMNINEERHYLSIVFFDNMGQVANPSGGTVLIEACETNAYQYGEIATITATEAGLDSTYNRPAFSGPLFSVRVTLTGIVGADNFSCRIGAW